MQADAAVEGGGDAFCLGATEGSCGNPRRGFSGLNYANILATTGQTATWTFVISTPGDFFIRWRYAVSTVRNLGFSLDRTAPSAANVVTTTMGLAATTPGDFDNWSTVAFPVAAQTLVAGTYTITLTLQGNDGPNIDAVMVERDGAEACVPAASVLSCGAPVNADQALVSGTAKISTTNVQWNTPDPAANVDNYGEMVLWLEANADATRDLTITYSATAARTGLLSVNGAAAVPVNFVIGGRY